MDNDKSRGVLQLLGVGWYVAAALILGLLGGRWLDNRLGTSPLLLLIGLCVGVALAFYGVYRMLAPILAKTNRRN